MKPHLVFAYGSNLHAADLDRWLHGSGYAGLAPSRVERAVLRDAALVWNYHSPVRRGGAANVADQAGARLPGAVLVVDGPLLLALDHKEGHPERYRRALEPVELESGHVADAWVYRVTPEFRSPSPVWPRRVYLDTVLAGARALGLPDWHLEALRAVPVRD